MRVEVDGEGPPLLLIHGSATDGSTWGIQRAALRRELKMLVYDRRVEGQPTVEDHAEDAARVILEEAGGSAFVCASSFGAVVTLELLRRYPQRVRAAVLIEPPLAADLEGRERATALVAEFETLYTQRGGPDAAEFFLRWVLTDRVYDTLPRPFQDRSKAMHLAIRQDCRALLAYEPHYETLREVQTPVLLVGGERSAPVYRQTLELLQRALGNARMEILPAAGHMLHAEASRRFNALLLEFIAKQS